MQIIVSLGKNVHELNSIRELIKSQYNIYDYHLCKGDISCVGNSVPPADRILSGWQILSTVLVYRPLSLKNVQEKWREHIQRRERRGIVFRRLSPRSLCQRLRTSEEWQASILAAFCHSTCQSSSAQQPPWPGSWEHCPHTSASSRLDAAAQASLREALWTGGGCSTAHGRHLHSRPGAGLLAAAVALGMDKTMAIKDMYMQERTWWVLPPLAQLMCSHNSHATCGP